MQELLDIFHTMVVVILQLQLEVFSLKETKASSNQEQELSQIQFQKISFMNDSVIHHCYASRRVLIPGNGAQLETRQIIRRQHLCTASQVPAKMFAGAG